MTSLAFLSSPPLNLPSSVNNHHRLLLPPRSHVPCTCSLNPKLTTATATTTRRSPVKAALDTATSSSSSASASLFSEPSGDESALAMVGSRVRVKVPLKVYHVPKVPEVELEGLEGTLKQYVAVWKGKHISANLPYKIEFLEKLEGRGDAPVKFVAHLKEDEFEYID